MQRIRAVRVAQIHVGSALHQTFYDAQVGRTNCVDQRRLIVIVELIQFCTVLNRLYNSNFHINNINNLNLY